MNKQRLLAALAAALCATASGQAPKAPTLDGKPPVVIAHRGASGYRPEHTLEAYSLAMDQGADYVEPDLVMTKDGVLVARHEPFIDFTTDVATRPEFASRRRSTTVDGVLRSGYFVSDFTLAELKTLRAVQPYPGRDKQHDGKFQVPTLDEVIALVKKRSTELKRTIGIYPEVKHSTWHSSIGLPIEDKLLATLAHEGWNKRESPVVIQSFEVTNLQYLRSKSQVRLAQLLSASGRPYDLAMKNDPRDYRSMATPAGLADIRKYADIVGANKRLIVGSSGFGNESQRTLTPPTTLIADAHKLGLQVHAWTFRSERDQLASDYKNDPAAEYRQFFSLGVDGVISDFPDVAVRVRDGR